MLRTCPSCSGFLPPQGPTCPHCGTRCREVEAITGEAARRAARQRGLVRGLLATAAGGAVSMTLMACYGGAPCGPECTSGGGFGGFGSTSSSGQGGGKASTSASTSASSSSTSSSSSSTSSSSGGQDGGPDAAQD